MTTSRDPDRLIHQFLLEGAEQLQDRVYDAVRAEIEQQRQRVVIGPWRMPTMNKLVPIGLGAAAVVVALVVGTRLLGPPASGGVGGAPSAEPSATALPSVAAPTSTPEGLLPEGPFVFTSTGGEVPVSVTIPAPGWSSQEAFGVIVKNENGDPPDGAAIIGPFVGELYVYGDPCQWSTTTPDTPATTVDEVVAALTAQASRDASAPVDITVDGHAGKSITLHVPDDAATREEAFAECDQDTFASWAGGGDPPSAGPSRYHQGPGQIDEVWILDVDGELIAMDAMYGAETPAEHLAELRAILESITFGE
jgi:hypothetical protein